MPTPNTTHWTVPEALAVAYTEFTRRFGADLLTQAFEALTLQPEQTQADHAALDDELGKYLAYPLSLQGADLVVWMGNARSHADNAALLLHCGVRWWHARDDLVRHPADTRVPCEYVAGSKDHHALQLLAQMLYRGSAPDTTPPATGPARASRQ